MPNFDASPLQRKEWLNFLMETLEQDYHHSDQLELNPSLDETQVRHYINELDLNRPNEAQDVFQHIINGLRQFTVHTTHPAYFGLFNPRANYASILADYITAVFNPQLAAWSHAPYANEIEQKVIREFALRFGYPAKDIDGTFCSGGAESNLTAVLCALNQHFPDYAKKGLWALPKMPVIYCSAESHHSIVKAAKVSGLGSECVKSIPVGQDLTMDIPSLQSEIINDLQQDHYPLMLVGTAGTTGAGAIDPLEQLAEISEQYHLWFHVDAAYGGAIVAMEEYRHLLNGIEKSDSITLDLHKKFSVPMGTSIFVTRNRNILHQSFSVQTQYMPKDGDAKRIADPYVHSIQWSRRLMGLKLYLPLAIYGWEAYGALIKHQFIMGKILRAKLLAKGWSILNQTELPIIIFTHPKIGGQESGIKSFVDKLVQSGKVWVSSYPIQQEWGIRVCITNYATQESDLDILMEMIEQTLESV